MILSALSVCIDSLAVGKYADLVELSTDIYTVPADQIVERVKVLGTWVAGKKIDIDDYIAAVKAIDPTEHQQIAKEAGSRKCC